MNNVKTNRTKEQAWVAEPDMNWTTKEIYYRGWERALESVVQEPALTEHDIEDIVREYRGDQRITAMLIAAGRIPDPATVETPQEGELMREWLEENWHESLGVLPGVILRDAILARHQQALSAREQAVRAEYTEALVDLEKRFHALTIELAAEKLANEGKYAIGERVELGFKFDGMGMIVAQPDDGTSPFCSGTYVRRHAPTLTNEQMAEAWVKSLEGSDDLGKRGPWELLAMRLARGETIEHLYRRDVLGAPKEQEES